MKIRTPSGQTLSMTTERFVAAGGEAEVYAEGAEAYKIYSDPTRVIARDKLAALQVIGHPHVLHPVGFVTDAKTGEPVGLSMPFLEGGQPLCAFGTASAWADNGLGAAKRFEWVAQLRGMVEAVHRAGVLAVDLNPMNIMVGRDLDGVFLIDVDSFQTARHPATAQADGIRDRQGDAGVFNEGTDWFAFAVVSFQLMMGVHPYRGLHPKVKSLDARMQANLSVFNDSVKMPHVASSFTCLPEVWRRWYRQVFEDGFRGPPPRDVTYSVMPLVSVSDVTSVALDFHPILGLAEAVYEAHDLDGTVVLRTASGVWMNGRVVHGLVHGRVAFGLAGPGVAAMACVVDGFLQVVELVSGTVHSLGVPVESVAASEGRMYAKSGGAILELHWYRSPKGWVCVPKMVSRVMPLASRLFHGVAVQTLLGSTYASLLTERGKAIQIRVPELDGAHIVDARYEGRVFMVRARRGGQMERWVFRLGPNNGLVGWKEPDGALNFTVLNGGVVVDWLESGSLRMFSNRSDRTEERLVDDEVLSDGGRLFSLSGGLGMIRRHQVFRVRLRAG